MTHPDNLADPTAPASDATTSLIKHKAFVLFWVAKFIDVLAVQVQAVAIAWQVYELARQSAGIGEAAFIVGMIGLAQFVALLSLTLFAGEAADRHDRRRTAGQSPQNAGQADPAQADDDDGLPSPNARRIHHRSDAGQDRTAEQRRLIERQGRIDLHQRPS